MNKIISETITLKCDTLPPSVEFIENSIKSHKLDVIRWAIVDIKENKDIVLSVSGILQN